MIFAERLPSLARDLKIKHSHSSPPSRHARGGARASRPCVRWRYRSA
jgi:hypothetical protein